MIAQLVLGMVMLVMAIALVPIITDQFKTAQQGIGMINDSSVSSSVSNMYTAIPYMFGAAFGLIAIMVIISALRRGGLMSRSEGVESSDEDDDEEEEEEDEEDEEDDDDDYDEDEDEEEEDEDEDEKPKKSRTHSTVVTTTKRTGEKKLNVKVGPGYNVDKYQLDKPSETKLTMKEEEFKKTRFD